MTSTTANASTPAKPAGLSDIRSNLWLAFALRRTWRLVMSLWVLITASFLMIHLVPGDPVRSALGVKAPPELVEQRRSALGLDDPLITQYLDFLGNIVRGDLGTSIVTRLPVSDVIGDRIGATIQLGILAFVVVVVVALPLGTVMAALTRSGRNGPLELGFTSGSVLVAAVPEFLLAVGLVYAFSVTLAWFPVAGRGSPDSYVLPVVALAAGPAAVLARIVRVEVLAVLGDNFIRTARAKRLPPRTVYFRHALPNALTAALTLAGLMLSGLVVGTVLVENVFAWQGLGSTIVQSILLRDYPMVQGIVLVYGAGVLIVNLLVDVLLAVLDPRSTIRES